MDTCIICNQPLTVTWTDWRGIAVCFRCNAPYWMKGFNGDSEIETGITPDSIDLVRRYWNEKHRPVMPGFGSVSREDAESFWSWMEQNAPRLAKQAT